MDKAVGRSPTAATLTGEIGKASVPWEPLVVTAAAAAGVVAFLVMAGAGWPGEPSRCLRDFICYCEPTHAGSIRQPVNTWSSLACVPVAIAVAVEALQERRAVREGGARVGLLFAVAEVMQGLGSMFFHGSLTTWGAVLDAASIFVTGGLVLVVNLVRMGVWPARRLIGGVVACVALAVVYRLTVAPVMAPLFLPLFVAILVTEVRARAREGGKLLASFWWAMASFGAGVVAWGLSLRPGFPLCRAPLPYGHAIWHVMVAVAPYALWRNVRRIPNLTVLGKPLVSG